MNQKLSILIPAYNEEKTITSILDRVVSVQLPDGLEREIIIINDASTDGTEEIVKGYIEKLAVGSGQLAEESHEAQGMSHEEEAQGTEHRAQGPKDKKISSIQHPASSIQYPVIQLSSNPETKIFLHSLSENRGKGAAIHKGIELATGDFILIQDADLEYDPHEYPILLGPILKGVADVVYGSRFAGGQPHRILFFWHSIGNKILTFLSNMFTNLNLTDMETCYKLFRAEFLKQIHFKENRFGFEPEVTSKIARFQGIRIYEVGISYYGRTYEEGKKIRMKDALRAVYCLIKYNIFDRRYRKQ